MVLFRALVGDVKECYVALRTGIVQMLYATWDKYDKPGYIRSLGVQLWHETSYSASSTWASFN